MILELKIQNFLSFKNEVSINFEATNDKTLEDYYVTTQNDGTRILKMAMIYGANASGKSNLISAFEFLNDFLGHIPGEKESGTGFIPFMFGDSAQKPGSFELTFYAGGLKYKYKLSLDANTVYEEKMHIYPGTQPALIFNRYYDKSNNISKISFGSKIKISDQAIEAIQLKTLKNTSVLAAYKQVNVSIPEIELVLEWVSLQFLNEINPYTDLTSFSDNTIKQNNDIRAKALEFLREADFNISSIDFKDRIKKLPEQVINMLNTVPLSEEEKEQIRKNKSIRIEETYFTHKVLNEGKEESYMLPAERQSKGTMRYYGLTGPFFHAIKYNAFMPVDEIGSALHPLLVMHFLKEFLQKSNQAQLLFTTHNMSLLNEKDILRKDAIWFTEKQPDGASDLYSLADFSFRKELSFFNAYKLGKFGAVPEI